MGTASSKSTHRRSASRVHARSMALDRLPGTNNMQPKRAATGCVTKCHQSLFALLLSDHQRQAIRTRSLARRYQWSDMIRSEEHTSELQSLMRISYAVFCLKKKKKPH